MRRFIAIALMLSVMGFTSVAYAFSSSQPMEIQKGLVMQITKQYESVPGFEPAHPAEAMVPFCAPPADTKSIMSEVETRCNSPG